MESHFQADPSVPGPGAYVVPPKFGEGAKYSFRVKQLKPRSEKNSPGPATYSPCFAKHPGAYLLSTCKSIGHASFSPKSLARFPRAGGASTPGPGSYSVEKLAPAKGGQFSCLSAREHFPGMQRDTPGPGSYTLPSDFGP